jgi:hypothetical protein
MGMEVSLIGRLRASGLFALFTSAPFYVLELDGVPCFAQGIETHNASVLGMLKRPAIVKGNYDPVSVSTFVIPKLHMLW